MAVRNGKWLFGHKALMVNILLSLAVVFSACINIPPAIKKQPGDSFESGEEAVLPAQRIVSVTHIMFAVTGLLQAFYSLIVLHSSPHSISNPQFNEKACILFAILWLGLDTFGIYEFTQWKLNFGEICQTAFVSGRPVNGCLNQDSSVVMLLMSMLSFMLNLYLSIHFYGITLNASASSSDDIESLPNRHSSENGSSKNKNKNNKALEVFVAQYSELINKPFAIDGAWYRYKAVKLEGDEVPTSSGAAMAPLPPPYVPNTTSPEPAVTRSGTGLLGALTGTPTTHGASNTRF